MSGKFGRQLELFNKDMDGPLSNHMELKNGSIGTAPITKVLLDDYLRRQLGKVFRTCQYLVTYSSLVKPIELLGLFKILIY